jgi:hypothetical protein
MEKKVKSKTFFISIILLSIFNWAGTAFASNYATSVVHYTPGSNATLVDPDSALGPPTRTTAGWLSGDLDVTMFNPPWQGSELVQIGAGGSLKLGFDHKVLDDPKNWFGLDFIVFGNAFLPDSSFPDGVAEPVGAEPSKIRVSQDNITWYDIPGIYGDDLFPTQGFMDTSIPYANDGSTPSNFLKPVDPALTGTYVGMVYDQLLTVYAGSGGGTGIDISWAVNSEGQPGNLGWIQYVELWQPAGDAWDAEIDAISDVSAVPIPGAAWLLLSGFATMVGFRIPVKKK